MDGHDPNELHIEPYGWLSYKGKYKEHDFKILGPIMDTWSSLYLLRNFNLYISKKSSVTFSITIDPGIYIKALGWHKIGFTVPFSMKFFHLKLRKKSAPIAYFEQSDFQRSLTDLLHYGIKFIMVKPDLIYAACRLSNDYRSSIVNSDSLNAYKIIAKELIDKLIIFSDYIAKQTFAQK